MQASTFGVQELAGATKIESSRITKCTQQFS